MLYELQYRLEPDEFEEAMKKREEIRNTFIDLTQDLDKRNYSN